MIYLLALFFVEVIRNLCTLDVFVFYCVNLLLRLRQKLRKSQAETVSSIVGNYNTIVLNKSQVRKDFFVVGNHNTIVENKAESSER